MTAFVLLLEHVAAHPLVHALGWSLLHFCWQGSAIAILLGGFLYTTRGHSPQLRYVAACCALVFMLLLPLITFASLASTAEHMEPPTKISGAIRGPVLTGATRTAEPWFERLNGYLDQALPWVIGVWAAGVILFLARLNLGLIAVSRMKAAAAEPAAAELQGLLQKLSHRLNIKGHIRLVNSALVQVPTVIGWVRPVILLPLGCLMQLSANQVEAILAHELAHVRRHDYLVSVFQSVVETLLFYHPAVWWVSTQVRIEREHCCDDVAVRIAGDPFAYARALSLLEENRAASPALALGANGGVLAMRIRRLLGYKETSADLRLAATLLSVVLVAATALCIGTAVRAASQQSTAENASNLPAKYLQWLNEDVVWIITPEERAAFAGLKADADRDKFMDQFWERRNPTPNSAANKAKEEHYRRIKYADEHFTSPKTPGWKTDRGRIYIIYGPPDEIDSHPQAGADFPKPTDLWRYHSLHIDRVDRKNVEMKFVDECSCGEHELQSGSKE